MKLGRQLGLSFLGAAVALAALGCTQPKSAADEEHTAVVMAASALKAVDDTCATLGTQKQDVNLLKTCADAYNYARPALVVAQYYADTGNEAGLEAELCVGVKGLQAEADAVVHAGGTVPPLATEALRFAGGLCKTGGA